MWKTLIIQRNQRVVVLRDGQLSNVLQPGRHWVLTWPGLVELIDVDIAAPLAPLTERDVLPVDVEGSRIVEVGATERLVRLVAGRVRQVLGPGRYRVWEGVEGEQLVRIDAIAEPKALGDKDRLVPVVAGAWAEASASRHVALVLRKEGEPVKVLPAGRYRVWSDGPWTLVPVNLGLNVLELAAQDVVTQDQVAVRVKPAATYKVVDPIVRLNEVGGEAQVYGAIQLALREVVAARTLEALVTDREALSAELLARARAALPDVGLAIDRVWVKDVTLPAEVKAMVNRVTLARKEAEALSIKRREEVAATRQLANTAKLLDKNPVLLRLKELEAMGELVGKIDKLVVIGGQDLANQVLLREIE